MTMQRATDKEVHDIWVTIVTDEERVDLDNVTIVTDNGVEAKLSSFSDDQLHEIAQMLPEKYEPKDGNAESLVHPEHGLPMVDWRVLVPPDEMPAPPEDAGPPDEPPIDRELEQLLDESSAD